MAGKDCDLGCFKLRTSEAPAAEAVTHTKSAIHADTQRGRSLSVSANCRFNSAAWFGRSLLGAAEAAKAAGMGEGLTTRTGAGGGDERGEATGAGVASEVIRGKFPGRGNGVLRTLPKDARGSGVVGRESCAAASMLGSGERVARAIGSGFSKANSKVAIGRS